ncbi:hypothetical protein [Pyrobaculum neutrophilum]|uniref:Uncharacterized protein n=1 Tax=Pyrobaculum neutrophilum (strain DSM 2338 / JCM 9278 / NBRC 100436 / V24Sta) TaxID=444157 RepID=B1YBZ1_PYRNV|nr:hypothetical protein [Pyrobaculum neutrophilum]ACB39375.1 hypothetical protein Tneu_0427 [Pyrobaculum neutrophilum V24Sta]
MDILRAITGALLPRREPPLLRKLGEGAFPIYGAALRLLPRIPPEAAADLRLLGVIDGAGRATPLGAHAARCAWIEDDGALGAVPLVLCRVRGWQIEEAHYCRRLRARPDRWLARAVELAGPHLLSCLPYGADAGALADLTARRIPRSWASSASR